PLKKNGRAALKGGGGSKLAQFLFDLRFRAGFLVDLFDHPGGDAGDDGVFRHIVGDDGSRRHHGPFADPYAFQDDGVGPDHHIVFDDHRFGRRRFNHSGDDGAGADVAVFADGSPAADDGIHVDHRPFADDGPDVDHRAHHDHRVFPDLHLFADDRAGFDPRRDVFQIEERNGRVAPVVFHHHLLNAVLVGVQHRLQSLPVAEDDADAAGDEGLRVRSEVDSLQISLDVYLHRGFLFTVLDVGDDFVGIHHLHHDTAFPSGLFRAEARSATGSDVYMKYTTPSCGDKSGNGVFSPVCNPLRGWLSERPLTYP